MDGWIDSHWTPVSIFAGDLLIDVEEVPITFPDCVLADTCDGISEIEVDAASTFTDATSFVANLLGRSGRNIPGGEVTEAGIFSFEIIIAFRFRNSIRLTVVAGLFWDPDAPV